MVLSQIETMYPRGTKISVSVLDLNVVKITTTARFKRCATIPLAWLFPGGCLRERNTHVERLDKTTDNLGIF